MSRLSGFHPCSCLTIQLVTECTVAPTARSPCPCGCRIIRGRIADDIWGIRIDRVDVKRIDRWFGIIDGNKARFRIADEHRVGCLGGIGDSFHTRRKMVNRVAAGFVGKRKPHQFLIGIGDNHQGIEHRFAIIAKHLSSNHRTDGDGYGQFNHPGVLWIDTLDTIYNSDTFETVHRFGTQQQQNIVSDIRGKRVNGERGRSFGNCQ